MDIRVYNRFLDLQFEISRYQSLQFERNHHGVGQFELHINRYSHGATHLDKGHLISLGKQQNKVGIILSKEIILDEKGKESESFKLTGYTLDGIMNRRVVVPPRHTSHDRKSGNAETVMKHYVNKHFVNPDDPGRRLDIMEIAPNQSRGEYISWESRWKTPIDEELEKISISTGLGWVVYADFKAKKFIFDVYESRDLTPGNRQGNNPVFFSPEYESIESQSFIDSDQDYKNVAYIGGQGEGVDRKIVTIGEATGWDRIETFVDARDVSNEDEETEEELTDEEVEKLLIERGKKKMRDMETIFSLEAKVSTPVTRKSYENNHKGYRHPAQPVQGQSLKKEVITPFEYEKDFDLGDRVEVRNVSWNLTMEAPITELIEIYEGDGFKLEATFGRSRPTLISKLKDKFDELEGIEKQEAPEQISVRRMNEVKEYAKKEDAYVREDAEEFANEAEENANKYTNEVDTQNREFTNYLMDKANKEIDDTKRRLSQAEKDLGSADEVINQALENIEALEGQLETLPDWSDNIEQINETLDKANADIDKAQQKIDSVTEEKDGQTVLKGTLVTNEIIAENTLLTGTFRGPQATIEELTTKDMYALRAIIEDAIVKGRLDANMATMLGLTTEEMIALNAIIQDATIKGTLNTNEAIFQKGRFNEVTIVDAVIERVRGLTGTFKEVAVTTGDFSLEDENTGTKYSASTRRNLLRDHSFELIREDGSSMGPDSIKYNWLEIQKPSDDLIDFSSWDIVGGPKVAITFSPDKLAATPMFGDKAIVVRNANYVRQYVSEGVAAGSTFTVSGHFKRQWNQPGGIPRIEIWHVLANGVRDSKITNSTFPKVNDDYSEELRATTFEVPSKFLEGDMLEVIFSGGDSNWVQCDGVQIVEGTRPGNYVHEDAIWLMLRGVYKPRYNMETLWTGARYPTENQVIKPAKNLHECMNGWVIMWSSYASGNAEDRRFFPTYIPKGFTNYNGSSMSLEIPTTGANSAQKYIYVDYESITGHSTNNSGNASGVVMRAVYEW